MTLLEQEKKKFLFDMNNIEKEHNIEILLAFVRGSQMYGTANAKSDVDITFVYQQPTEEILKTNYVPYIDVDGKGNVVGYEIQRYIELLSLNNPNILESLDIPKDCIIHFNPNMRIFNQKDWLSKLTEKTFLGYADSQIKKATGLNKNMNNPQPKERKSILDFCYIIAGADTIPLKEWVSKMKTEFSDLNFDLDTVGVVKIPNGKGMYGIYFDYHSKYNFRGMIKDQESTQLRLSSIPKEISKEQIPTLIYYNLDGFEVHCKQWKSYWLWMEEKNEERFNMNQLAGQGVDLKNMMHLFRLLEMCDNISQGKGIITRSSNVLYLLDIREGKYHYEDLLKLSAEKFEKIKENFKTLNIQEKPNQELGKNILLQFRKNG